MKLEPRLRDDIQRQREAKEHEDFLRGKVDKARAQARAGLVHSSEEVEREFAERRARLGKADA